ncbi:MAG: porin family protein [Hydrocarboniphaga sp.]|uniref:outer membrane protein n=1 Tax=Hydrocarboniphaga sp. TaxID=2033016 RepID=UPI00261DD88B|nr:outer membrane beta-barrel protein [Hydrocarboniphaga sp.]MDB5968575.1 porin family protein [Hydrocarboniphaga sp.]
MNVTKKLLLSAVLVLPTTVFANEAAHVDGYYIPSSTWEVDGGSDDGDSDGDGFGVKAWVPFGRTQNFFLEGEYQSTSIDSYNDFSSFDIDQLRLGGGWQVPLATGSGALYGEYVSLDQDGDKATGFGAHGRLAFPIARNVQIYGQAGYLWLQADNNLDLDGPEFLIGGSVDFSRNIGAFIDYRYTSLEDNDNIKYNVGDLRLGVRILFDTRRM